MNKIQTLIEELKQENSIRAREMNKTDNQYEYSALLNQYNLTIEFIKKLEKL